VSEPRIAVIERTGAACAPEQAKLGEELRALQCRPESIDPQLPDARFDPRDFDLVVNRLSASSFDVDSPEPVFARAVRWLTEAEATLGASRVFNGPTAQRIDASKIAQQKLIDARGVGVATRAYRDFAAIVPDDSSPFGDRAVFLKLAAGGSGKGTLPFLNFAHLRRALRERSFDDVDEQTKYAALEETRQRLARNLRALNPADEAPDTVVVQETIDFDPEEAVFRRFRELRPPATALAGARWVLRAECWDYAFRFGAWMASTGTNFCHANGCSLHRHQEVARFAESVPPEVSACSVALARDAGMRLAGVEWIRDRAGDWRVIDINSLSIMRTEYRVGSWEIKDGDRVTFDGDTPAQPVLFAPEPLGHFPRSRGSGGLGNGRGVGDESGVYHPWRELATFLRDHAVSTRNGSVPPAAG
jgi:hypothetical protein